MSTVNPAPFQLGDWVECDGQYGTVITQILSDGEWTDVYVTLNNEAKSFAIFDGSKTYPSTRP